MIKGYCDTADVLSWNCHHLSSVQVNKKSDMGLEIVEILSTERGALDNFVLYVPGVTLVLFLIIVPTLGHRLIRKSLYMSVEGRKFIGNYNTFEMSLEKQN